MRNGELATTVLAIVAERSFFGCQRGTFGDKRMTTIEKFIKDESAATAIEYGIAACLISIVAILGMGDTGQEVNNLYSDVGGAVGSAAD
jgi:Flp pilus assembly pilin Flp